VSPLAEEEDVYCCLGAACELYQEVTGDQIRGVDQTGNATFDDQGLYLPLKVQEWLGLSSNIGRFDKAINGKGEHSGKVNNLAQCNDDNFTFDEIADIIESEPPGLFKD